MSMCTYVFTFCDLLRMKVYSLFQPDKNMMHRKSTRDGAWMNSKAMKGTVYGFKRSLKNCHLSLQEEPNDSHLNANVCVWMSLSVFCLCTCLCWMFVQSPTKKKQALMHIDRLFRSLSGVLYWFRGLTFRTVPVWRVNRLWQASCTTTRPIRG